MRIILLPLILFLSSCAMMGSPSIVDSSKRICISGISVLPPQMGNWSLLQQSTYQLVLAKEGKSTGESFIANVSLYQMPDFKSDEDFVAYVKNGRSAEPDTGRFKVISNIENLKDLQNAKCVFYKTASRDQAAKTGNGNADNMLLESVGYHCMHPARNTVGIHIEFSARRYVNSQVNDIENRSVGFFDNVKFIAF